MVRPIFDVDSKLTQEPSDAAKQEALTECKDKIAHMFEGAPGFDAATQIAISTRHVWVDDKYKLSFHGFVKGFSIRLMDTRSMIHQLGDADYFDCSIYPKTPQAQQLFTVIGGRKMIGGAVMTPVGLKPEGPFEPADFLAQHLDGTEQELVFDGVEPVVGDQPICPAQWDDVAELLEREGFLNPVYKGTRASSLTFTCDLLGLTCLCCGHTHEKNNWWISARDDGRYNVKNYSERCKVKVVGVSGVLVVSEPLQDLLAGIGLHRPLQDQDGSPVDLGIPWPSCMVVRQHLEVCPSCKGRHAEDCYLVETLVTQCCTVRNVDSSCPRRLLVNSPQNWPAKLRQIILTPYADSAFADLFLQERPNKYISDGDNMYEFDGNRWKAISSNKMKNVIESWLQALLELITSLLAREGKEVPMECRKQVNKAMSHVKAESGIHNIVKSAKRKMCVEDLDLDADPFLLGADNCVINLRDGTVRQGRPEDLVSRSVGYSIPYLDGQLDEAKLRHVSDCMSMIYPVEAEREVAQRYGGYCLRGDHPAKRLVLCTDAGGGRAGNNAKTTFAKLLAEVLGVDYAMKGKNPFLYKTDSSNETADGHNAGLLVHKGRRMAYFEELDPKRRLNNGLLKVGLLEYYMSLPSSTSHYLVLVAGYQWR